MLTRRELGQLALALPAAKVLGDAAPLFGFGAAAASSKIEGVQIGLIAPYSFGDEANDANAILDRLTTIGISGVELQNGPVEAFAGAPAGMGRGPGRPPGPPGPGGPGARPAPTPEQQAAQREAQAAMAKWRISQSMDPFKALRRKYNDAGVGIYAFKLTLTPAMSDEEYEYTFSVAEALGASHLTMELPTDGALTKRIGEFAARRKMLVGYHTHTQGSLTVFDEALAQSKYNAINVDIGHYVAGTSESPIPLIEKHHARFASIHLKDRKKANGPNMPWGQGDTPIKEVLQLMKKAKYTWPATIELEYPVPEGSTRVAEIGKCLQYCKDALTAKT
jgi:sugar phosphate isomerase/epimerase